MTDALVGPQHQGAGDHCWSDLARQLLAKDPPLSGGGFGPRRAMAARDSMITRSGNLAPKHPISVAGISEYDGQQDQCAD
jgi:hypothetical protein